MQSISGFIISLWYKSRQAANFENSGLIGFWPNPVYANYIYDTSVIFSNFIITYNEPFTGPS